MSGATQAPLARCCSLPRPGSHGLWRRFPDVFWCGSSRECGAAAPPEWACNPACATPAGLTRTRFGPNPGSLAATTGMLSVPRGTEMFQFPRCPPSSGDAVTARRRSGCPIRRSWAQRLLAAPPRFSQLCHVLHRHTAPRHPPYAHCVFPAGTPGAGARAVCAAPRLVWFLALSVDALGKVHCARARRHKRRGLHP